jgi:hypothetical protein
VARFAFTRTPEKSTAAPVGLWAGLRKRNAGAPFPRFPRPTRLILVRPIGIEPMTLGLGVPCSILLSYGRKLLASLLNPPEGFKVERAGPRGIVGTLTR